MYQRILVTLDRSSADRTILEHIRPLARMFKATIVLLHVADGWAARTYGADAVHPEVREDREYLDRIRRELCDEGINTEAQLAYGEPKAEIVKWVEKEHCDLIAMSTHGHRFLADLFLGATAHHVQHRVDVPVLLVRAKRD
ncbi:MAG TPA: universal stress protein [Tepidisphaeraceae bacterium]|jgi:nucleotide-binding universal stress UspA family protein|nr:universal stress protein [Tepidisphaeraceae bacterium]